MAKDGHEPVLQWIVVNGQLRSVTEFKSLTFRARRAAEPRCPICHDIVTLKLGDIRTHHFAHTTVEYCKAYEPETIWHFNTKQHLYKELLKGNKLYIRQPCGSVRRAPDCEHAQTLLWLEDWDTVETEYSCGPFRLDVALLKGGAILAALEVEVTHANEPGKLDYLAKSGIPCITVRGADEIYEGDNPWTTNSPLGYLSVSPELQSWICPPCTEHRRGRPNLPDESIDKPKAKSPKRDYRIELEVHASAIVDFYYADGSHERDLYRIYKDVRHEIGVDPVILKVWLTEDGQRPIKVLIDPSSDWKEILFEAFKLDVQQRTQESDSFADIQEKWFQGLPSLHHRIIHGKSDYPMHYQWQGNSWLQYPVQPSWLKIDEDAKRQRGNI